jgi:hypothetical protein
MAASALVSRRASASMEALYQLQDLIAERNPVWSKVPLSQICPGKDGLVHYCGTSWNGPGPGPPISPLVKQPRSWYCRPGVNICRGDSRWPLPVRNRRSRCQLDEPWEHRNAPQPFTRDLELTGPNHHLVTDRRTQRLGSPPASTALTPCHASTRGGDSAENPDSFLDVYDRNFSSRRVELFQAIPSTALLLVFPRSSRFLDNPDAVAAAALRTCIGGAARMLCCVPRQQPVGQNDSVSDIRGILGPRITVARVNQDGDRWIN